jgi:hypothetical protein
MRCFYAIYAGQPAIYASYAIYAIYAEQLFFFWEGLSLQAKQRSAPPKKPRACLSEQLFLRDLRGGAGFTRFARFTRVCFLVRVENRSPGQRHRAVGRTGEPLQALSDRRRSLLHIRIDRGETKAVWSVVVGVSLAPYFPCSP